MINPLRFWTRAPQARRTLLFASATHVWSDLIFALYAPLLPLIKDDLDLTFTEVAMLKSLYAAAMAVLQIPVGFMADRAGEFWLLVGGNIWVAVGLIVDVPCTDLRITPGIHASRRTGRRHTAPSWHPASSPALTTARPRATAVGTVNFAGDLGKMAAPAITLVVAISHGWRGTMLIIGIGAIAFFLASMFIRRSVEIGRADPVESKPANGDGRDDSTTTGFKILSVVGFIDGAIRAAALTFVPFILDDRGMEKTEIFVMLILLLAGGGFRQVHLRLVQRASRPHQHRLDHEGVGGRPVGRDGLCADGNDCTAHGAARRRTKRHVVISIRHRRDLRSAGPSCPHVWIFLHHQRDRRVCGSTPLRSHRGRVQHPHQYGPHGTVHRDDLAS